MGENLASHDVDGQPLSVYPAYRENTIESFQQAAKCGVGFVEFDVQVGAQRERRGKGAAGSCVFVKRAAGRWPAGRALLPSIVLPSPGGGKGRVHHTQGA